jgi:cysteine synthase A
MHAGGINMNHRIDKVIGNTPLLALENIQSDLALGGLIYGKLESANPGGSIKSRIAKSMIEDAEARGLLGPGSVIIEPTSGNTGVGLAMVAAAKGYRTILTMPETMSVERRKLLKALGAELVLTQGTLGMNGAIARAKELATTIPGSFIPGQFDNPANPQAHFDNTGPEIWEALAGKVDVFVVGVGTGGTITGVGRYLKMKNPSVYIVAVEPDESAVLSGEKPGPHAIQGIGAGFVPTVLDTKIYDEIIRVKGVQAIETAKMLSKREGILAGISSGAAVYAAIQLAKRPEYQSKNIVTVLPDTGERYLSTVLFQEGGQE